jgi:hypothetical protein
MKMQWMAGLMLVLGALSLAAQSTGSGGSFGAASGLASTDLATAAPDAATAGAGCPVSLQAQHKADGSVVRTSNVHPKGVGQWLHLRLANPQTKRVTEAQVTVHGLSNKPHVTKTAGSATDEERTMTVSFAGKAGEAAEADLWVPEMTAVESLDLNSATFDDGAVWNFAGSTGCRIAPDPMMLIAGK